VEFSIFDLRFLIANLAVANEAFPNPNQSKIANRKSKMLMASKKSQRNVGIPAKRRGQQMGDSRSNPNVQAEAEARTPPLSGRRKSASKLYGDESSKEIASDATGPSSTSPSVPGAIPTGNPLGQSGGEKIFKRRARKSKKE
jgi:hypothetical protein